MYFNNIWKHPKKTTNGSDFYTSVFKNSAISFFSVSIVAFLVTCAPDGQNQHLFPVHPVGGWQKIRTADRQHFGHCLEIFCLLENSVL
jgi:hypothetical protein